MAAPSIRCITVTSSRLRSRRNQIGLSKVIIMPNNVPPHRPQPEATSAQRVHMLKLAIADKPLFTLDERELRRDTLLTAQTLQEWRQSRGRANRWRLSLARIRY